MTECHKDPEVERLRAIFNLRIVEHSLRSQRANGTDHGFTRFVEAQYCRALDLLWMAQQAAAGRTDAT